MSPQPWHTHTRPHFFKFTTSKVAELILQSGELKWSAPDLFNDPFDHQVSLIMPFTHQEAAAAIFNAQAELIFGPKYPAVVKQTLLGQLSLGLRAKRYSDDEMSQMLFEIEQGSHEVSANLDEFQKKMNSIFQNHLRHSRILCLSETNENVVMWSHYAEQHRGVVFKLRCVEEIDDNLLIARPIKYVDEFPKFVSAKRWAEDALGLDSIDAGRLADSLCYLKHKDWSYEREWRVILPLFPSEPKGNGIRFEKKDSRVFEAVYLGCRMPEEIVKRLSDTAVSRFPAIEIYRASQSSDSFQLNFNRIY